MMKTWIYLIWREYKIDEHFRMQTFFFQITILLIIGIQLPT